MFSEDFTEFKTYDIVKASFHFFHSLNDTYIQKYSINVVSKGISPSEYDRSEKMLLDLYFQEVPCMLRLRVL